jgi:hypothetical protein
MKLNGDLSAENTDDGACFKIILGTSEKHNSSSLNA